MSYTVKEYNYSGNENQVSDSTAEEQTYKQSIEHRLKKIILQLQEKPIYETIEAEGFVFSFCEEVEFNKLESVVTVQCGGSDGESTPDFLIPYDYFNIEDENELLQNMNILKNFMMVMLPVKPSAQHCDRAIKTGFKTFRSKHHDKLVLLNEFRKLESEYILYQFKEHFKNYKIGM